MTGKGGVGKTTLSCAVAHAAHKLGKRVCLVEVNPSPNLRYILHREIPVYEEIFLEENFSVLTLEPFKAMEEYIRLQVKLPGVARVIMNNPIVGYFLQSAPGWRELVTVGKIWYMQDQKSARTQKPLYDLIVVDAPATGHGLSFLQVPAVFINIFRLGRMQGQSKDLQAMLTDPARTMVCVVTLPEEMAVNEAVTIIKTAQESLHIQPGVTFFNCMRTPLFDKNQEQDFEKLQNDPVALETLKGFFPDSGQALFETARARRSRAELSKYYQDVVLEKIGGPIVSIPQIYPGRVDYDGVKEMSALILERVADAS